MKVSVCIPTYNSGKFIGETIESVLNQTFTDFELIICDNVSTDETEEVCRKYTDHRLKYVRFDEFVTQSGSWNRALKQANNEYLILLHSDDLLLPTFLEEAVNVLDANNDVGIVCCTVQHIDENGKPLKLQITTNQEDSIDRESRTLKRFLLEGCIINPAGVLVRKSVYEKIGDFTDEIVWGVDAHMWTRIALNYAVAYLGKPLALYRHHTNSGTSGVMKTARNGTDELWMVNDVFKQIPASRKDIHELHPLAIEQVAHRTWCHAEALCEKGDMVAVRAGVKRSVMIHPPMLMQLRVPILWLSSFFGYGFFKSIESAKKRFL